MNIIVEKAEIPSLGFEHCSWIMVINFKLLVSEALCRSLFENIMISLSRK